MSHDIVEPVSGHRRVGRCCMGWQFRFASRVNSRRRANQPVLRRMPWVYSALTVIGTLLAPSVVFAVSVTVTVWLPTVTRVTEKVWAPASPPVKV